MKSLRMYASIALSGLVLAGTLSACKKSISVTTQYKHLNSSTKVIQQEKRIIQPMPCLSFSEPVDAIIVNKTGEQVVVGTDFERDKASVYMDKYVQAERTETTLVLNSTLMVCIDVMNEDGKIETKPFSAYTDLLTGALVIFPNGVIEQTLVGTEKAVYEHNGKIMEKEVPIYKNVLSFTTGQTVTEIVANVDMTKENHIVIDSYLEENITR